MCIIRGISEFDQYIHISWTYDLRLLRLRKKKSKINAKFYADTILAKKNKNKNRKIKQKLESDSCNT